MSEGTYYEKSPDPNIVYQWSRSEIYLDKLQKQINDLSASIAVQPPVKTKPDQETLDLWNMMNPAPDTKALIDIQNLMSTLKALK